MPETLTPEEKTELDGLLAEVRDLRARFVADAAGMKKRQNAALERLVRAADKKKIAKVKRALDALGT